MTEPQVERRIDVPGATIYLTVLVEVTDPFALDYLALHQLGAIRSLVADLDERAASVAKSDTRQPSVSSGGSTTSECEEPEEPTGVDRMRAVRLARAEARAGVIA